MFRICFNFDDSNRKYRYPSTILWYSGIFVFQILHSKTCGKLIMNTIICNRSEQEIIIIRRCKYLSLWYQQCASLCVPSSQIPSYSHNNVNICMDSVWVMCQVVRYKLYFSACPKGSNVIINLSKSSRRDFEVPSVKCGNWVVGLRSMKAGLPCTFWKIIFNIYFILIS